MSELVIIPKRALKERFDFWCHGCGDVLHFPKLEGVEHACEVCWTCYRVTNDALLGWWAWPISGMTKMFMLEVGVQDDNN